MKIYVNHMQSRGRSTKILFSVTIRERETTQINVPRDHHRDETGSSRRYLLKHKHPKKNFHKEDKDRVSTTVHRTHLKSDVFRPSRLVI